MQKFLAHPLWQVGFRPFFSLACISGMVLPLLWLLLFRGRIEAPMTTFTSMQWHAHEMFFGFGWAVIGGFLLTASKNWVQIRGYHGLALAYLTLAWLIERLGMWYAASLPSGVFLLTNNLFLLSIVTMLAWTLVRHHATDSYRDNYFFLIVLPCFLLAKNLLLLDGEFAPGRSYFELGVSLSVGLFRVAFLVMLERTLGQFMKNVFKVDILRHPGLDKTIKLLAVVLVFEYLYPRSLSALLAAVLALLLFVRFFHWAPRQGFSRLDIAIMYLGYLSIVTQLALLAAERMLPPHAWVGTVSIHVFTFGVMGWIIPAMLVRISKGHTGRKVVFDGLDKGVLWLMLLAFVIRLLIPQLWPASYFICLDIAAACWFASFGILGWRYIPFLFQARVDGKVH